MLFTITGKHIDITDHIRKHAEEKTAKLPKFFDDVKQIEVIIDEGPSAADISVEIVARSEHGDVFVATQTGKDAYTCIDLAVHKLEEQLRRKKEKQRDRKHSHSDE